MKEKFEAQPDLAALEQAYERAKILVETYVLSLPENRSSWTAEQEQTYEELYEASKAAHSALGDAHYEAKKNK